MGIRRQAILIAACVLCAVAAEARKMPPKPRPYAVAKALTFEATLAAPKETKLGPGPMVVTSKDGTVDVFYGGKTTYVAVGKPGKMKRRAIKAGRVYRAAISADGKTFATVTEAGDVGLWASKTGKRLGKWKVAVAPTNGLELIFVADTVVVHTGCRMLQLAVKVNQPTTITTPTCVEAEVEFANRSEVLDLGSGQFVELPAEDSDTGEYGYVRRSIHLVDPASGDHVLYAGATDEIEQVAVSPTGDRVCFLVVKQPDVWCSTGSTPEQVATGVSPESLLSFDPDGKRLVFADASDRIILVDFVARTTQHVATTPRKRVVWLDGHRLGAYGGKDGLGYEVFDLSSGKSTTLLPDAEIDLLVASNRADRWLVARAKGGGNVFYEARAQM